MKGKTQSERIIFGLKVKQLRQKEQLSFSELSKKSKLSVSYLNEIEKGKKFPKEDKIKTLAESLGTTFEELTDLNLGENLAPIAKLVKSNFLNELPLDLFGIDLSKVVEIIATAPTRVGAFISTLLELSRNYSLAEEHFYFGALRSYLEMHNNYFEDLEQAVEEFSSTFDLENQRPLPENRLKQILINKYAYLIDDGGLHAYPELNKFRSVFLPNTSTLLLSPDLKPIQKTFEYGKEIAFNFLSLKERALTSSIVSIQAFEEVLNHSKAIYFSVALHIPKERFVAQIKQFFSNIKWEPVEFLTIMQHYQATPEMFYHRLTNILPKAFGIRKLFFLRFVHDLRSDNFTLDRELHLNKRHHPHGNGLSEHYCRRWNALSLLRELKEKQDADRPVNYITQCQISSYWKTADEYLTFTIARPSYPAPNKNVAVTIGILLDKKVRQQIAFMNDPNIRRIEVHTTCERCGIQDCSQRVARGLISEREDQLTLIQKRLNKLNDAG